MKRTYPLNGNPICPNDHKDCNDQDMDGYTDCSKCPRWNNGVRETGGMPLLNSIYQYFKNK